MIGNVGGLHQGAQVKCNVNASEVLLRSVDEKAAGSEEEKNR